jgi:hypothetical protein
MKKSTQPKDPRKSISCNAHPQHLDLAKLGGIDQRSDLSADVYDMLVGAGMDFNSFKEMITHKKNVSSKMRDNMSKWVISVFPKKKKSLELRRWLKNRKLEKYVDFSDDVMFPT